MDLDFFFGTSSAPPSKPPPQPAASNAYDFFPSQQQQQQQGFSQQPAYSQQGGFPQQPYPQQSFAPLGGYSSQPSFGAPQSGFAPQPSFASSQPAYGQSFGGQPAFYGQAPAAAYPQQSGAALLPQPSAKSAASNNSDFFDMFGGDLGAKPAGAPQPQAQAQPAQPQTIQFSNDDFLDLLGAPSSAAVQQPAVVSRTTATAVVAPSHVTTTTQASTFKRGQSKKDAAAKKDLNLDAFSQLAVSRQKSPVAASATTAKKIAESESESESESEDDDDDRRGARNIEDEEQNMGTGQGFTPMDHQARSGGQSGGGSAARKCVAADCNNTFNGAGRYCAAHQRYESAPTESKDADGRKVKGEWSIERKRTGTKMGFIKNITIWKFYFKGEQHTIELRHSTFSGKRVILVDRRQLLSEKRLIGGDAAHKVFAGSDFETRCEVTVVIKSNNDRFQYGIFIEGLPIRDAKLKYAEYI